MDYLWYSAVEYLLESVIVHDIVALSKPALFNLFFALASIPTGFPFAVGLALAKSSKNRMISLLARGYIYAFRGSPLFIQFFMIYSAMLAFNVSYWKPMGIDHIVLSPLFLGPFVLTLNTSAYSAEIFYGAIRAVPKEQIEAARSVGMNKFQIFYTIIWPNAIRLAWPAYTNEVVFLFHATAIIYYVLPVIDEQKDLMNRAGELFEKDYNVFLHFSVAALYFLVISILIFYFFGKIYQRLIAHLNPSQAINLKIQPNYMR